MNEEVMNRKKITIIFVIISIIIIVSIIAIFSSQKKDSPITKPVNDHSATSIDPISGEEITTSPGKDKETTGINPRQALFLGFQNLIKNGVTYDDVTNTKMIISNYLLTLNFKESPIVSLKPSTLSQHITGNGNSDYSFDFYINSTDRYTCHIVSDQINSLTVTISKDSKAIYTQSK